MWTSVENSLKGNFDRQGHGGQNAIREERSFLQDTGGRTTWSDLPFNEITEKEGNIIPISSSRFCWGKNPKPNSFLQVIPLKNKGRVLEGTRSID